MINLLQMTDGFKVILGSFFVHLAALITMIVEVRPPEYTDDMQRTDKARSIYWCLLTMHMCICIVRGVTIFVNEDAAFANPFLTLYVVIIVAILCKNWVYPVEDNYRWDDETTIEQKSFEVWIKVEFFLILSFLACTMIYILICKFKMPTVVLHQQFKDEKKKKDFITASSLILEVLFIVVAPATICSLIDVDLIQIVGLTSYMRWNKALPVIQALATLWFIFATRVGPNSAYVYMKYAPEFTFANGLISFCVMPLAIIAYNTSFLANVEDNVSFIRPLAIFMLTAQGLFLLWSAIEMIHMVIGDLHMWRLERSGYEILFRRGLDKEVLRTTHIPEMKDEGDDEYKREAPIQDVVY